MKRTMVISILTAVVLFPVGWLGGKMVFDAISTGRAPSVNPMTTGTPTGPGGASAKPAAVGSVAQQAFDAYNRGDYPTAMPLFKKYVSTLNGLNDADKLKIALAYVTDIQKNLDTIAAGLPPAAPKDQAHLVQQATMLALATPTAADPTTEARVPHKPIAAGQMESMTIKELANFEFDPTTQKAEDVPADVRALEGAHLKLSGYMIPLNQADAITKFALVPSLVSCCYGQPPGVQHVITVEMEPGKTVDYSMDELEVEGTLHINVLRQDGYTYQLFEFTGKNAKLKE